MSVIASGALVISLLASTLPPPYSTALELTRLELNGIDQDAGPTAGGTDVTLYGSFKIQGQWITQIAASDLSSVCALDNNGKAYCWGSGSHFPVAIDTTGVLASKTLVDISVGDLHTCVIDDLGQAYCWGQNWDGRLGDGTTTDSLEPVAVDTTGVLAGKALVQIAAGSHHTCAIDTLGQAYCWGANWSGQLGDGTMTDSLVPVAVDATGVLAGKTLAQITMHVYFTCALDTLGQAYCWGANWGGQLGDGTTTDSLVPVAVDTTGVLAGKQLTSIALTYARTCAIDTDGQLYCWGDYDPYPSSVVLSGALFGKPITQFSVGGLHSCAVSTEGLVYCWGENYYGQLGDNTYTSTPEPVPVDTSDFLAGKSITQIATGMDFTCALDSEGQVFCWGSNMTGQLGNIDYSPLIPYPIPVQTKVSSLENKAFTQVSSAAQHTCAINTDGQAYCWGYGSAALGNGSTNGIPEAVDNSGALNDKTLQQISAGYDSTCTIDTAGKAYCWGNNYHGQIGDGTGGDLWDIRSYPSAVDTSGVLNGKTLQQISVGYGSTCAIDTNGKAYCWGDNNSGQLGNGLYGFVNLSTVPVAVDTSGALAGKTLTSITSGAHYACALDSLGQAYCWGINRYGQLGDGSWTGNIYDGSNYSAVPVPIDTSGVLSGKTLRAISAGYDHVCAVDTLGQAYCWGNNDYGQLGDGTIITRDTPVAVDATGVLAGKTLVQIALGERHTCALDIDGYTFCWGNNVSGMLGNGSTAPSRIPVAVDYSGILAGKTIKMITGGYRAVHAIDTENTAYYWGDPLVYPRPIQYAPALLPLSDIIDSDLPASWRLPFSVIFDVSGTPAPCINVVIAKDGRSLTCTTSAHPEGRVGITVSDGLDTITLPAAFEYTDLRVPNTGFSRKT